MSIRSIRGGIRGGLQGGLNPGFIAALDSLSQKYVPATASQWTALGLPPATDSWGCQEASGNLVSDAGTVLTANASPLYQQSVTGWTRKAVGFNAGVNQRFQHATYANVATTSVMALMYIILDATPAVVAGMYACGTNASQTGIEVDTAAKLRPRSPGGFATSATIYNSAIVPVVFQHDRTAGATRMFTETEKLTPTYGASVGQVLSLGIGVPPSFRCVYFAAWKTAAGAERSTAATKAMLTALRWSPTWTP